MSRADQPVAAGRTGPYDAQGREPVQARARLFATGGAIGAVLASSCCIVPLLLVTLGISGAWVGSLTALEPYKAYFLAAAAFFLAGGFWHVYRKPQKACAGDSYCARPALGILVKTVLWTATALVVLAATVDYWAPIFY